MRVTLIRRAGAWAAWVMAMTALTGCASFWDSVFHGPDAGTDVVLPMDGSADDAADADPPFDAPATDVVIPAPTIPVASLAGWLTTYDQGGTIDVDGDRTTDITVVANADGSRDIRTAGPHGDRATMHWVSTTNFAQQRDDDGDGTLDATFVVSESGGTVTRVDTSDRDFDGTPDQRITQTENHHHVTSMVEQWLVPTAGGARAWTVTSAYATDTPDAQCAVTTPPARPSTTGGTSSATGFCSGYCTFDCLLGSNWLDLAHNTQPIPGLDTRAYIVTGGMLACNARQVGVIQEAFTHLPDAMARLQQIDPADVTTLLAQMHAMRVVYACGYASCTPSNTVAVTLAPGFDGDAVTAITGMRTGSMAAVDLPDHVVAVAAVEELVFHELFHLFRHHDVDPGGQDARDHIYGCSRYMANWAAGFDYYLGVNSDASSSRDGAVCATLDHKGQFGQGQAYLSRDRFFYETAPGASTDQPICTTSRTDPPTALATCGIQHQYVYCDQTDRPADDRGAGELDSPECALACPTSAPVIDAPCSGTPARVDPTFRRVDGCDAVTGHPY